MIVTKVFQSGNSQAVRLPKDFRLDVDEVEIFRRGDEIVLRKLSSTSLQQALEQLPPWPDDIDVNSIPDLTSEAREGI